MWYDEPVATLLEKAAAGVESAWQEIFRRYSPLVSAICRHYGFAGADADDVAGNVWLRVVAGRAALRTPEALPGWLATITRRQCHALLRDKRRHIPSDQEPAECIQFDVDLGMLAEERRAAVRSAVTQLSQRDQRLVPMLFADPPTPYAAISSTLGMPIGAIGPVRQRCLTRMRRHPAIAALLVNDRHVHQGASA